jgi:ABC-type polysaccharide/polyol phosphate export permease
MRRSGSLRFWLDFFFAMTYKELKARYKRAVFGFLWIIINPLLQMIVIGLVFQFFVPVSVENYFEFLFAGLLVWNFFSYTITKNTPMIVNERALIQKAKFPREIIVLSIVGSNFVHLCIGLALFLIYLFVVGKLSLSILYLPFGLVQVSLLVSGLSLYLSALNVKYRDITFFVTACMPLLFYATPIIYTLEKLPRLFQFLLYLNPMTAIIQFFQFSLLGYGKPEIELLFASMLTTLALCYTGIIYFYTTHSFFDDWL